MAKDRVHKADEKASKEKKSSLDKKVHKRVQETEAATTKISASEPKVRHANTSMPNGTDSLVPSKSSKSKATHSSTRKPTEPPPPLLDMIHNFLKDFEYVKAARGVKTDNQKKPGHNIDTWKHTSDGLPDLVEVFAQWQQQNPRQTEVGNGKLSSDTSDSSSSSESDSEVDMATDAPATKVNGARPKPATNGSLKRKASDMSSDSSSSASSDSESDSSSDSSSSESEKEETPSQKRRKLAEVIKQDTEHIGATNRPNSSGSESEDESDSDDITSSSSSSDSEDGGVPTNVAVVKAPSKTTSTKKSSVKAVLATNAPPAATPAQPAQAAPSKTTTVKPAKAKPTKEKPAKAKSIPSKPTPTTNGSDTSATASLSAVNGIPAKAPYSTSGSSSATEKDSGAIFQMNPARLNRAGFQADSTNTGNFNAQPTTPAPTTTPHAPTTTTDLLTFPSTTTPGTQETLPATAANERKLKKQAVPFSRIPEGVHVDERFASNKYVSYDYADRAHQDLIVTRGKGFTKEKNKKKRGAYRGGAIDFAPKGIRFDD